MLGSHCIDLSIQRLHVATKVWVGENCRWRLTERDELHLVVPWTEAPPCSANISGLWEACVTHIRLDNDEV